MSEDGEIVAGHGRVAAARLLGLQTVPALRLSHLLVRGNYIVR
jgi:ParB-like chromosome segregation protein Spo0J